MTEDEHQELLGVVKGCRGKVLISGYANELYDEALRDWNRYEIQIDNKASGAQTTRKMTEVVWMN